MAHWDTSLQIHGVIKKVVFICNILLTKRKNMVKSLVRSQRRECDISNLSEPYFFVIAISVIPLFAEYFFVLLGVKNI